jgi:hypothetical protein
MGWGSFVSDIKDDVKPWAGTAIGTLVAPGLGTLLGYGMVDQPRAAQRDAEEALGNEQQRIADAIARRNANIAQLRGLFGVGDSADAKNHARTIADAVNNYYQQYLRNNLRQAEQGFAGASRVSRQNLARVGQLGSGLDAGAQSSNLADFLRARQRAITSASSARDGLTASLTSQRLGLENQIGSGSQANPDFAAYAAQRDNTLQQAQKNIIPAALGDLFTNAGQAYFMGRTQEAQGNQGLQAFGLSGGGTGGRVT